MAKRKNPVNPFRIKRSNPIRPTPPSKRPPNKKIAKVLDEVAEIQRYLDKVRPLYARLDELTLSLVGENLHGSGWQISDTFSGKNVAFKMAFVRRYELKRSA